MKMSRLQLISAVAGFYPETKGTLWDSFIWTSPKPSAKKSNKVSQKKRRLYARRLGK